MLRQNSIFSGLHTSQLAAILPCITSKECAYASGETVFQKGDSFSELGIVLKGELSLCNCARTYECGSNACASLDAIRENEVFGEAVAFSSDCAVPCDMVARKDSRVLYLKSNFFLKPCLTDCPNAEAHRIVLGNMLRLLSDKASLLGRKVEYLSAPDLRVKIAMYLCDLYDASGTEMLQLPLKRDALAEFLGVARPSLSREMIRLREEGIIDFERSHVTIKDPDALRELTRRV